MILSKLSSEEIEQLQSFIKYTVKNEVEIAMSEYSNIYAESLKKRKSIKLSNTNALCKAIGKSRQQVHNWEQGKVHGINISEFVVRRGRLKFYDVEGIKAYLSTKID